jgi:hypothetical protein
MRLPKLKTILLTPVILFALVYIFGAITILQDNRVVAPLGSTSVKAKTIAIFGASGTAGDGILKAALASPDIEKIHIITRRVTPRIKQGVASGKVQVTIHKDYLNYQAVIQQFKQVDAVYWAIGINSLGVDEKTYAMIHVDFPMKFVEAWSKISQKSDVSFHYISSSDISDESTAMWARQKRRAEKSLFGFAKATNMRVIAYRPDYIGATKEEAHLGQDILYCFFKPIGAAVKAEQIGQAMIEVSARNNEFKNGDKLYTGKIIRYSDAYEKRQEMSLDFK